MPKIHTSKSRQSFQKSSAYSTLLHDIKLRIRDAQYQALRAVNKELVQLYWDIGHIIVKKQDAEGWGKSVVEKLALDLHKEFPGLTGFSVSNLWRMRNLFLNYEKNTNLAPLVREISWSHNLNILERCNDNLEREFYIRMTRRMGWSKNVLIHQIENKTYEKTMVNQTNFKKTLPEKTKTQAHLAVKDDYVLDFLNLKENHDEQQLEQALLTRMNRFLIEMGGAFAFMGNQYRLEVGGQDFFIDILLYHRRLNCLVALDVKSA